MGLSLSYSSRLHGYRESWNWVYYSLFDYVTIMLLSLLLSSRVYRYSKVMRLSLLFSSQLHGYSRVIGSSLLLSLQFHGYSEVILLSLSFPLQPCGYLRIMKLSLSFSAWLHRYLRDEGLSYFLQNNSRLCRNIGIEPFFPSLIIKDRVFSLSLLIRIKLFSPK